MLHENTAVVWCMSRRPVISKHLVLLSTSRYNKKACGAGYQVQYVYTFTRGKKDNTPEEVRINRKNNGVEISVQF